MKPTSTFLTALFLAPLAALTLTGYAEEAKPLARLHQETIHRVADEIRPD